MVNSMIAFASDSTWIVELVIQIVLAVAILVSAGFITFVVMKQSGNSDGLEAIQGGSSRKDDDNESFYGKNSGMRTEAKLKKWTYICSIVLAVCCIAFIIVSGIFAA